MQESFAEVCRRIGIPKQRLPVVNAAAHRPYDDYYDDELRRLVTRFYRRDFEMLGYPPMDSVAQRPPAVRRIPGRRDGAARA